MTLPAQTEYNKRIPKQKFYENLNVTPEIKRCFIEKINTIYWRNKIAPSTVNVAAGREVAEVEVFLIHLASPELPEDIMRLIDREIPYHILFLLEYEGMYQAWIGYKEAAQSGAAAFKVNRYYHTEWMDENSLPLSIYGLDMDAVYENFVRQIAGEELQTDNSETLKESVERAEKRRQLEKQIDRLESKLRKEKQLNRQMEINAEIKRLRKELKEFI